MISDGAPRYIGYAAIPLGMTPGLVVDEGGKRPGGLIKEEDGWRRELIMIRIERCGI